jgi:alpha-L-rhamnosidase
MKSLLCCISVLVISITGLSQTIVNNWENKFWTAKWVTHPDALPNEFGVYHFRKDLTLDVKPSSYIVHISADNLYKLLVNGIKVASGPARSDPANWNYETLDLAPYLKAGKNIITATVWNFADFRAYAQTSFETAFIVQGNSAAESVLNTPGDWKVIWDKSYQPLPIDRGALRTYLAVASGEIVDGNQYAWGFDQDDAGSLQWKSVKTLWYPAKPRSYGTDGNWHLVPRAIPLLVDQQQEFSTERSGYLEKNKGTEKITGSFPWNIPADTKISLLLDQGMLTNGYPQLIITSGKNAAITLTYAEALMDSNRVKGNRNEVKGKMLIGISDRYISDGGTKRAYSPLHYRTFRYVKMDIQTGNDALVIENLNSSYTGYPFEEKGKFISKDKGLQQIWETGWRTAKLCAVDTYFDCPYYEQLQYVGDTRIQAFISLYVGGDDRLMKKAIDDISHSFIPEGLTQSRYPSWDLQVIPTFSLWWVCMIHDHYMHRKDDEFIRSKLNGIENVLRWYEEKMAPNGMLGALSWWQFVDWSWPWVDSIRVGGVPPGVSKGGSSIVSLQYAYTLVRAAELMKAYGRPEIAAKYKEKASKICSDVYKLCFDQTKGMIADTHEKKEFSQHANILAILTDAVPVERQKQLLQKLMTDKSITQATYYFKFYMFEAMKKTGLGDQYLAQLKPWYDMLSIGLTTFAENPEPTRSDCHAWSASPLYEMLSTVAGVLPAEPGFGKVIIKPHPGNLAEFAAVVPHPKGEIKVELSTGKWTVDLPAGLSGDFEWKGKKQALKQGRNEISQ